MGRGLIPILAVIYFGTAFLSIIVRLVGEWFDLSSLWIAAGYLLLVAFGVLGVAYLGLIIVALVGGMWVTRNVRYTNRYGSDKKEF